MLWFSEAFISSCLRLTQLTIDKDSPSNIVKILHYFLEYILIQLFSLFYLLSINYFQSQRPSSNQIMMEHLAKNRNANNIDLILLQNSIYKYEQFEYKALNTFTNGKGFLFTFVSTVITFTVMVIQLIQ